mgnify:CR=1 FL=1
MTTRTKRTIVSPKRWIEDPLLSANLGGSKKKRKLVETEESSTMHPKEEYGDSQERIKRLTNEKLILESSIELMKTQIAVLTSIHRACIKNEYDSSIGNLPIMILEPTDVAGMVDVSDCLLTEDDLENLPTW